MAADDCAPLAIAVSMDRTIRCGRKFRTGATLAVLEIYCSYTVVFTIQVGPGVHNALHDAGMQTLDASGF